MSAHIDPRSPACIPNDARLALTVTGAGRSRCGLAVAEFSAVVHEGVATLHGQVRGYYQKQVLLAAVQGVPGIERVIDRVVVLPLEPRRSCTDSDVFEVWSVA